MRCWTIMLTRQWSLRERDKYWVRLCFDLISSTTLVASSQESFFFFKVISGQNTQPFPETLESLKLIKEKKGCPPLQRSIIPSGHRLNQKILIIYRRPSGAPHAADPASTPSQEKHQLCRINEPPWNKRPLHWRPAWCSRAYLSKCDFRYDAHSK